MAYRPQNECLDCASTWHPRGRDVSLKCPACGGDNVAVLASPAPAALPERGSGIGPIAGVIVGSIALAGAVVGGALAWNSLDPSTKQPDDARPLNAGKPEATTRSTPDAIKTPPKPPIKEWTPRELHQENERIMDQKVRLRGRASVVSLPNSVALGFRDEAGEHGFAVVQADYSSPIRHETDAEKVFDVLIEGRVSNFRGGLFEQIRRDRFALLDCRVLEAKPAPVPSLPSNLKPPSPKTPSLAQKPAPPPPQPTKPEVVSPLELWRRSDDWKGRPVRVTGPVTLYPDPKSTDVYFTDPDSKRRLVKATVESPDLAKAKRGEVWTVTVEGTAELGAGGVVVLNGAKLVEAVPPKPKD